MVAPERSARSTAWPERPILLEFKRSLRQGDGIAAHVAPVRDQRPPASRVTRSRWMQD